MVNDIYALRQPRCLDTVLNSDIMICLMHMKGSPQNMQLNPSYNDVVGEVVKFLQERIIICEKFGIEKSRIILDPGFGFGKTYENNLKLFQSIDKLNSLSKPLLIGVSRKSMVRKIVGDGENDIISGSAIMAAISILRGSRIVRVHDVKETKNALKILQLK